jgi:CHAD domain-containing protein
MASMQKIQKKYKDHCKMALNALHAFKNKTDPEQLHTLRVELKKIKALLKFHGSFTKNSFKKTFRYARYFFKLAGNIRANQLILESIKNKNQKKSDQVTTEIINDSWKILNAIEKDEPKIKKSFKSMKRKIKPPKKKDVIQKIEKKTNQLRRCFYKARQKPELFHDCRKKIKSVLYVLNELKPSYSKKADVNLKKLDTLQELIGKLHDVQELKKATKKNNRLNIAEKKYIDKLKNIKF